MTDQNRRLKDGIRQAVSAIRGDEHSELLHSILGLAEAAGIDVETPAQPDTIKPLDHDDITIDAATGEYVYKSESHEKSHAGLAKVDSQISQRLTCGIWLDPLHYTRASLPPEDILPYLGPGAKTFAGQLFWSMAEHGQTECKHRHPDQTALFRKGLMHSKPTQSLEVPFMKAMLETRLEYKRTGFMSPEHAAAGEVDLGIVLRDRIEKDYRGRGKDPDSWLSCVAIEKRARRILGNCAVSLLEEAAEGRGDPSLRDLLASLTCRVYEAAICFGDGPRCHVDVVDEMFLDWIRNGVLPTSY